MMMDERSLERMGSLRSVRHEQSNDTFTARKSLHRQYSHNTKKTALNFKAFAVQDQGRSKYELRVANISTQNGTALSWESPMGARPPYELMIELAQPGQFVREVRMLVNQYKSPSKAVVFIGLPHGERKRLGKIKFQDLGKIGFSKREVKCIDINASISFVHIVFEDCYRYEHNPHDQIQISGMVLLGKPLEGEAKVERSDDRVIVNNNQHQQYEERPKSVVEGLGSPVIITGLDIRLNSALDQLREKKANAESAQEYDQATHMEKRLCSLRDAKEEAVKGEDYGRASELKVELNKLLQRAMSFIDVGEMSLKDNGTVHPKQKNSTASADESLPTSSRKSSRAANAAAKAIIESNTEQQQFRMEDDTQQAVLTRHKMRPVAKMPAALVHASTDNEIDPAIQSLPMVNAGKGLQNHHHQEEGEEKPNLHSIEGWHEAISQKPANLTSARSLATARSEDSVTSTHSLQAVHGAFPILDVPVVPVLSSIPHDMGEDLEESERKEFEDDDEGEDGNDDDIENENSNGQLESENENVLQDEDVEEEQEEEEEEEDVEEEEFHQQHNEEILSPHLFQGIGVMGGGDQGLVDEEDDLEISQSNNEDENVAQIHQIEQQDDEEIDHEHLEAIRALEDQLGASQEDSARFDPAEGTFGLDPHQHSKILKQQIADGLSDDEEPHAMENDQDEDQSFRHDQLVEKEQEDDAFGESEEGTSARSQDPKEQSTFMSEEKKDDQGEREEEETEQVVANKMDSNESSQRIELKKDETNEASSPASERNSEEEEEDQETLEMEEQPQVDDDEEGVDPLEETAGPEETDMPHEPSEFVHEGDDETPTQEEEEEESEEMMLDSARTGDESSGSVTERERQRALSPNSDSESVVEMCDQLRLASHSAAAEDWEAHEHDYFDLAVQGLESENDRCVKAAVGLMEVLCERCSHYTGTHPQDQADNLCCMIARALDQLDNDGLTNAVRMRIVMALKTLAGNSSDSAKYVVDILKDPAMRAPSDPVILTHGLQLLSSFVDAIGQNNEFVAHEVRKFVESTIWEENGEELKAAADELLQKLL